MKNRILTKMETRRLASSEDLDTIAPKVLTTDLAEVIQDRFAESRDAKGSKQRLLTDSVSFWNIHGLARELSMSLDDVRLIKTVFDRFDSNSDGTLDHGEFERAVEKLLEVQLPDVRPSGDRLRAIAEWNWWGGDEDGTGSIDFKAFLRWYSSNGFHEDMLLTENQRALRTIAKRNGISVDYVERIKRYFDSCDINQSGGVDMQEFKQILCKVLKIPHNLELPESRVQYFWSELDPDGSGTVDFEEFLVFWLKYFSEEDTCKTYVNSTAVLPFELFYRHVRCLGRMQLDPPPYPSD